MESIYIEIPRKFPLAIRLLRMFFGSIGRLMPSLSARLYWRLFTTPRNRNISNKNLKFINTSSKNKLNINGINIQIYSWGSSNKKVLLVHGWEGMAADFQRLIEGLVKAGFQVESLDLPAHGLSEGKRGNMTQFIAVLQEILEKKGPFDALVAHSLGAAASMFMLSREETETYVSKMVLIGIHPVPFYFFEFLQKMLNIDDILFGKCITFVESKLGVALKDYDFFKASKNVRADKILLVQDHKDEVIPIELVEKLHKEWSKTDIFFGEYGGHFRNFRHADVIEKICHWLKN